MQDSWVKLYVIFRRNGHVRLKFETILIEVVAVDHIKTNWKIENFPIKITRNAKDKPFKIYY